MLGERTLVLARWADATNSTAASATLRFWDAGSEGFCAGLHCGDAAAALWRAVDDFFDALHPFGEIHFSPKGFYVGLDFCVLEIHFLAGVVDETFPERSVDDEGADHVPVAEDLEDVGGLLVASSNAVDEFVGRVRLELCSADIRASLAHDGLAAEFVEVEEEFGLLDGGFGFWHEGNLARGMYVV